MATLANLVKNIDPPVEITQEEYNNLTEEQKNDGTVYYIVDGSSSFQTAATTPAEASNGTGSNVQAELDKRLEISKLVNGGTATEAGYALDARYGKTLADQVSSLSSRLEVKHATYTGTTNSGGVITGGYSNFGMSDGTICIAAFLQRDSYGVFRKVDFGMYGNAGLYVLCSEGTSTGVMSPINNGTVTIDFYYI